MNILTTIDKNGHESYIRWRKNERIQHWFMAISFIILVVTGFALKYPDSWWIKPVAGIEWVFDLRGLLHRIAGAIFMILGFYHTYYMLGTKRGRKLGIAFLPNLQDVKDFIQNIAYNFGLTKKPPMFGHFSYMEKAEYLALIWGAIIMGVSGLMLWFEDITLIYFPKWIIDLLTVIHLYEAWLATLAIVVWHFYYIILNPDIYPINTSMINGKISEKEMHEEYFLEWKEIKEKTGQQFK